MKESYIITHPEEYVNPLAGTFSDSSYSNGNTLPIVSLPWGFNHWAIQSKSDRGGQDGSWWFNGEDKTFSWIRCTHQPSPWIGDWGYFLISPQVGNDINRDPMFFHEPRAAIIKPYVMETTLAPDNIKIELTPSQHGAIIRVTFPKFITSSRHVCVSNGGLSHNWNDNDAKRESIPTILGYSTKINTDRSIVANFKLYFQLQSQEATQVEESNDLRCFHYDSDKEVVHIYASTSLISFQQVKVNNAYENKIETVSFDDLKSKAKEIWNHMLSRVSLSHYSSYHQQFSDDVSLDPHYLTHVTIFYTCLYRSLLFPRRLDELNENMEVIHYSPYDPSGGKFPGPLVVDNGFWDTFRTVYPLLTLIYPDYLGDIIQGWLNAYKEGGWLPSWSSPGYRNCMVGTYADVVIADAIVNNIHGFDINMAIEAILKDSYAEPPRYAGASMGKEGIKEYIDLGYVSNEVSRSLDFGFADFAVANAIKHVCNEDYQLHQKITNYNFDKSRCIELQEKQLDLSKRALRPIRALFNKDVGLMVAKTSNNVFRLGFNDIEWGNGYTEGNAWHHSFPPYGLNTLIELYSSKENMIKKLDELFHRSSIFQVGSYHQTIHEMIEMRTLAMGQYGHNNQPCHHIPYLYILLNQSHKSELLIHEIIQKAYGIDFYSGDEDNGEQSAWFVLSSLGIYNIAPSSKQYLLSSPLFKYIRIKYKSNSQLDIPLGQIQEISSSSSSSSSSSLEEESFEIITNLDVCMKNDIKEEDKITTTKIVYYSLDKSSSSDYQYQELDHMLTSNTLKNRDVLRFIKHCEVYDNDKYYDLDLKIHTSIVHMNKTQSNDKIRLRHLMTQEPRDVIGSLPDLPLVHYNSIHEVKTDTSTYFLLFCVIIMSIWLILLLLDMLGIITLSFDSKYNSKRSKVRYTQGFGGLEDNQPFKLPVHKV